MDDAQILLEYVRLLLSAPLLATGTAISLSVMFRKEIRGLLNRVAGIKLPWVGELSMSQVRMLDAEGSSQKPTPDLRPESVTEPEEIAPVDQKAIATADPKEIATVPSAHELSRLRQLVRSESANALRWEYRYLNRFLVRSTQAALNWLGAVGRGVSIRELDNVLQPFVVDAKERNAVLTALQMHHLVDIQDGLVQVTEKGREYLEWRGPLPPLPPGGLADP